MLSNTAACIELGELLKWGSVWRLDTFLAIHTVRSQHWYIQLKEDEEKHLHPNEVIFIYAGVCAAVNNDEDGHNFETQRQVTRGQQVNRTSILARSLSAVKNLDDDESKQRNGDYSRLQPRHGSVKQHHPKYIHGSSRQTKRSHHLSNTRARRAKSFFPSDAPSIVAAASAPTRPSTQDRFMVRTSFTCCKNRRESRARRRKNAR